ncbi:hypothetical protein D3C78_1091600 [compost metagenome]
MTQRLISSHLVCSKTTSPETVTGTTDIPVAQLIDKLLYRFRRVQEVIDLQPFIHRIDQAVKARNNPAVQLVIRFALRMCCIIEAIDRRIQREERMGIHNRIDNLRFRFPYDAARKAFAVPWRAIRKQCPSECVRTEFVNDLPWIDNVALRFGHFLTILVQYMASRNDGLVRSLSIIKR